MCCANKTFLLNFFVWLITLIGLSPVASDWAATFEDWTGISVTSVQATVVVYQDDGETALHAHVFVESADWENESLSPAVVTFHRTQSERDVAYALCREMVDEGYMAITFEYPAFEPDTPADEYAAVANAAMQWIHENLDVLNISSSEIAVWATGYANSIPGQLAVLAASSDETTISDTQACPSALILLFPPALSDREGAIGFSDTLELPLWLDDIHRGIPFTSLILSDESPANYAVHAENLLAKMEEIGIPCEIVHYPGESWEFHFARALRNELAAIGEAMDATLQSLGFRHIEEE